MGPYKSQIEALAEYILENYLPEIVGEGNTAEKTINLFRYYQANLDKALSELNQSVRDLNKSQDEIRHVKGALAEMIKELDLTRKVRESDFESYELAKKELNQAHSLNMLLGDMAAKAIDTIGKSGLDTEYNQLMREKERANLVCQQLTSSRLRPRSKPTTR